MMNNFRKIISVFLSVLLLMTVVPVTVGAVSQTSGQCGDNVFWSYDETTKTFTVSGSGATYNYSQNDREWVSSSIDTSSVDYCTLFVVIENGVTAIGDCMFMGFDNLLRVDMADTVTSIGEDVFKFCYDLKFVNFSINLETIGDGAFRSCENMTSIEFPDTLKSIGKEAFRSTSLQKISLPESLTSISYGCFMQCKALTSVVFPSKLESIDDMAFYMCQSLSYISIPASVNTIGIGVFGRCTSLNDIYVSPDNTTFMVDEYGCLIDNKTIYQYPLANKRTSFTVNAKYINDYAFADSDYLESVNIVNVYNIGENSFSFCSNLQTVIIEANYTTVGYYAFDQCAELNSFLVKNGHSSIVRFDQPVFGIGVEKLRYVHFLDIASEDFLSPGENDILDEHYCTYIESENPEESGWFCPSCNKYVLYEDLDLVCNHLNVNISDVVEATCTKDGFSGNKSCVDCGEVIEAGNVITALGHNEIVISAVAPSCTKTGLTEGVKCSVCGEILVAQNEVPASGHAMGEFVVTKAPTCKAEGEEKSECANCDYYETRVLSKAAHKEVAIPEVLPTCTKTGLTEGVKCSVCGEILVAQNEVPASGHAMGEYTVTKAPTCKAEGEEKSECANCDYYETRVILKAAHKEIAIPEVLPTCTKTGLTEGVKCSVCGDILVAQTTVPENGHNMKLVSIIIEPSCTQQGISLYSCITCGEAEEQNMEIIDHDYETILTAPTCTEIGFVTYICKMCGLSYVSDEKPVLGHTLGEYVVDQLPTCSEYGSETAKCIRCDYVETRIIEKTPHDLDDDFVCNNCGAQGKRCIHICHKDNIFARIVWGIIRYICSIFGVGKTCSCGMAHY